MRPAAQPSSLDSCPNTSSRWPEEQEYCCDWELHQLDLLFRGVLHFQGKQLLSASGSCDITTGYGQLWWLTVMVSSAQAFGNLGLGMIKISKERKKKVSPASNRLSTRPELGGFEGWECLTPIWMGPWSAWSGGRCSWLLPMAGGCNEVILESLSAETIIPLFCQLYTCHAVTMSWQGDWNQERKVIFKDSDFKCWVSQIPFHCQVWEGQNM